MNTQKSVLRYSDFSNEAIAAMLLESFSSITAYANAKNYRQTGQFPSPQALETAMGNASKSMKKQLVKFHFRLQNKLAMRSANLFMHSVAVKLLRHEPTEKVARLSYSEKEAAIKASRAAWVKAREDAEALRLAYIQEKGDFYKG